MTRGGGGGGTAPAAGGARGADDHAVRASLSTCTHTHIQPPGEWCWTGSAAKRSSKVPPPPVQVRISAHAVWLQSPTAQAALQSRAAIARFMDANGPTPWLARAVQIDMTAKACGHGTVPANSRVHCVAWLLQGGHGRALMWLPGGQWRDRLGGLAGRGLHQVGVALGCQLLIHTPHAGPEGPARVS